jgi:hypothetical protein
MVDFLSNVWLLKARTVVETTQARLATFQRGGGGAYYSSSVRNTAE